jgi:hypothetical protein
MADLSDARLLGKTDDFVGAERTSMRGMFPYAVSESDLLNTFWVTRARECLNRAVVPNNPDAGAGNPDGPPPQRQQPGLQTPG